MSHLCDQGCFQADTEIQSLFDHWAFTLPEFISFEKNKNKNTSTFMLQTALKWNHTVNGLDFNCHISNNNRLNPSNQAGLQHLNRHTRQIVTT